ncbi:MAG: helix-turn-helix domain-containing protein [Chlamydiales bacterium]|nr:helix-turn-helix domain-containing protein [Chlamydiales bacterium]
MTNHYSVDLRKRVIDYVLSGKQIKAASSLFHVSRKTIYRWLQLLKNNGNLNPKTPSSRKGYKIHHEAVAHYFSHQPDATLKEVADTLSTHPSAIWYVCKKMKITRKKSRSTTKKEMRKDDKNF